MDYRVYRDNGDGYKYINTYQLDDVMFLLDLCILEEKTSSKILVIWHDYAMDCDSPFYLFTGYNSMTEKQYKHFRKTILEPYNEITKRL